jgi:hypothetical protein
MTFDFNPHMLPSAGRPADRLPPLHHEPRSGALEPGRFAPVQGHTPRASGGHAAGGVRYAAAAVLEWTGFRPFPDALGSREIEISAGATRAATALIGALQGPADPRTARVAAQRLTRLFDALGAPRLPVDVSSRAYLGLEVDRLAPAALLAIDRGPLRNIEAVKALLPGDRQAQAGRLLGCVRAAVQDALVAARLGIVTGDPGRDGERQGPLPALVTALGETSPDASSVQVHLAALMERIAMFKPAGETLDRYVQPGLARVDEGLLQLMLRGLAARDIGNPADPLTQLRVACMRQFEIRLLALGRPYLDGVPPRTLSCMDAVIRGIGAEACPTLSAGLAEAFRSRRIQAMNRIWDARWRLQQAVQKDRSDDICQDLADIARQLETLRLLALRAPGTSETLREEVSQAVRAASERLHGPPLRAQEIGSGWLMWLSMGALCNLARCGELLPYGLDISMAALDAELAARTVGRMEAALAGREHSDSGVSSASEASESAGLRRTRTLSMTMVSRFSDDSADESGEALTGVRLQLFLDLAHTRCREIVVQGMDVRGIRRLPYDLRIHGDAGDAQRLRNLTAALRELAGSDAPYLLRAIEREMRMGLFEEMWTITGAAPHRSLDFTKMPDSYMKVHLNRGADASYEVTLSVDLPDPAVLSRIVMLRPHPATGHPVRTGAFARYLPVESPGPRRRATK